MSKTDDTLVLTGIGLIAAGALFALLWSSFKNCNRGCQNIAQHLIEHGISDIILGLF